MSVQPTRTPAPRTRTVGGVTLRILLLVLAAGVAGVLAAAAALPLVGAIGLGARTGVQDFESLPAVLVDPPLPQRSVILAADGSPLATVYYENRVEVPLDKIAVNMRNAIVAVEDARFYEHSGVDLRGALRALAGNFGAGQIQEGGSTLTMQYVKNVLITQAQTEDDIRAAQAQNVSRKLQEWRYAIELEKRYSKDEILNRYLNIAYFGAGAYGVEAAARRYFSTSAASLTLPQAATLAGIVQRPSGYDPLLNPRDSTARRNVVLGRMLDAGMISQSDHDAAVATSMESTLKPREVRNGCTVATSIAPYFCDYVLEVIRQDPAFGETQQARENLLRQGGLTIRTTLDPKAQDAAQKAAMQAIPYQDPSRKGVAVSMVEPGTGKIVAMAQNRRWGTSGKGFTTVNYNVSTQYHGTIGMQTGSTFKAFALAAALQEGESAFEEIESPAVRTFKDFKACGNETAFPDYTARNSGSSGFFNMYEATALSVNTYFLQLEKQAGICKVAKVAEDLGIKRGGGQPILRVPSMVLGTNEVTPLAMASAYAAFAAHGTFCDPIAITEVIDRDNKRLAVPDANCREALPRGVADAVTSLLMGVIDGPVRGRSGETLALANDRVAAGKTGTNNESSAVWFVGYTPSLSTAVWTGDPRGGFRYPMQDITINGTYYSSVTGAKLPGPIWRTAMDAALKGTPKEVFNLRPTGGVYPEPAFTPEPDPIDPDPTGPPDPTGRPTGRPTDGPTGGPTAGPTGGPTVAPTDSPGPTTSPAPTQSPAPTTEPDPTTKPPSPASSAPPSDG